MLRDLLLDLIEVFFVQVHIRASRDLIAQPEDAQADAVTRQLQVAAGQLHGSQLTGYRTTQLGRFSSFCHSLGLRFASSALQLLEYTVPE